MDIVSFLQDISTRSESLRVLKRMTVEPRLPGEGVTLYVDVYAFGFLSDETVAAVRRAKALSKAAKPGRTYPDDGCSECSPWPPARWLVAKIRRARQSGFSPKK